MLVTEDVRWQRCLPALDTIEVLYLEFVSLDAAVLAGMPLPARAAPAVRRVGGHQRAHLQQAAPPGHHLPGARHRQHPARGCARCPPALGTGFNGSRAAPAFHIVLVRPGRCRRLLPAHAAACPTCVHG